MRERRRNRGNDLVRESGREPETMESVMDLRRLLYVNAYQVYLGTRQEHDT